MSSTYFTRPEVDLESDAAQVIGFASGIWNLT